MRGNTGRDPSVKSAVVIAKRIMAGPLGDPKLKRAIRRRTAKAQPPLDRCAVEKRMDSAS